MFQHKNLLFRQLFHHESSTYTYLVADADSREAVLIDPVESETIRDLRLINDLGLDLKYIIDTHVHADHITGAAKIREATGAKIAISGEYDMRCPDVRLKDGDTLKFGSFTIKALATPGHTVGCMSYHVDGIVFTGDALFIRATGRTDFQGGSASKLFDSVHSKLFTLPDETLVYPAHDYNGNTVSTIGEEKKFNPRLGGGKTKAEFEEIMANLNLAEPLKIKIAVPANLDCGYQADRLKSS